MRQGPYCQELLSSLKRRVENTWPDVWWEPKGIIRCAGGGVRAVSSGSRAESRSRNPEEGWVGHRQ